MPAFHISSSSLPKGRAEIETETQHTTTSSPGFSVSTHQSRVGREEFQHAESDFRVLILELIFHSQYNSPKLGNLLVIHLKSATKVNKTDQKEGLRRGQSDRVAGLCSFVQSYLNSVCAHDVIHTVTWMYGFDHNTLH